MLCQPRRPKQDAQWIIAAQSAAGGTRQERVIEPPAGEESARWPSHLSLPKPANKGAGSIGAAKSGAMDGPAGGEEHQKAPSPVSAACSEAPTKRKERERRQRAIAIESAFWEAAAQTGRQLGGWAG